MLKFMPVILIMTFLTTVLLVYGLYSVIYRKRIAILNRLETSTQETGGYVGEVSAAKPTTREQMGGIFNLIAKILPRKEYLERRKVKLAQAAILMRPEEFLGISVLAGGLAGLLVFLGSGNLIASLIGFFVGFKIPDLFLDQAKSKRSRKINNQLPEALTIVANGLRAGYSFNQSMSVASKELENPIADEFSKVIRENSLGKPIEEALVDMTKRAEDEDIDMFVTALIIQKQVGGNLAEILDTISETIRERVKLKGEIKTLTTEGKFSAVIISVLPIAIAAAMSILNPGYIGTLITHTIGIALIVAAVIMELIGIYLLGKIVDIDI